MAGLFPHCIPFPVEQMAHRPVLVTWSQMPWVGHVHINNLDLPRIARVLAAVIPYKYFVMRFTPLRCEKVVREIYHTFQWVYNHFLPKYPDTP